tara:strand:- start:134 stop:493 length:360 start_codon:yes stop_codon:yes gene_type:complete
MRHQAIYETHPNVVRIDDSFGAFDKDDNLVVLNESLVTTKINEIYAAEPMRLLRIERDKRLQESDWRTNNDYPYDDADAWATYRTALRNLPAEITAGNVTAPTIENNSLIFNDWPEVPA